MNGLLTFGSKTSRDGGGPGGEIKYPANCATRISMETNVAAAIASHDGIIDIAALDKLYEPKQNKKFFKVFTVVAYIFSVSMVAILLSLYYLFLWNPYIEQHRAEMARLEKQRQAELAKSLTTTMMSPLVEDFHQDDLDLTTELAHMPKMLARRWDLHKYSSDKMPKQTGTTLDPHLKDPFVTYAKEKRAKYKWLLRHRGPLQWSLPTYSTPTAKTEMPKSSVPRQ